MHSELRLAVISILIGVEADFVFLRQETGATAGNLSVQLDKLARAGYIEIEKGFRGKMPAPSAASPTPGAKPSPNTSRRSKATSNSERAGPQPTAGCGPRFIRSAGQSAQKKGTRNGTLKSSMQPWKIETTA